MKDKKGNLAMRKNEIVKELEKLGLQAEWQTVNKNGVLHTGIVIVSQVDKVAPIIYTDGLVKDTDSLDMAVNKILAQYQKVRSTSIDADKITSRDYVLEHITIAVQKDGIEKIVKRESGLDGIEAYLVVMDSSFEDGSMSMKVTANLLLKASISESEAWKRAEQNLHKSVRIQSMAEVMAEIMGEEFVELCGVDDRMYVISNKSKIKGASAILDKETMEEFAKKHNTKRIAVLPSSVHEMLLVPETSIFDEEALSYMVRDVNTSEVVPEERLTDRAYILNF